MVTYKIDNGVLWFVIAGDVSVHDRQALFDAIRSDDDVPLGAPLIVDARGANVTFKDATLETRLLAMIDGLGAKLGDVCAFIEAAHDPLYGKAFQRAGRKHGMHVGLFKDETSALRWLKPHRKGQSAI